MTRRMVTDGLSVRVSRADMKAIDEIAAAKEWSRSEAVRRIIEDGLENGKYAVVRQEAKAAAAAAAAEQKAKQEEAKAKRARYLAAVAKHRTEWRALDGETGPLLLPVEMHPELPFLRFTWYGWDPHGRGWSPEEINLLKRGISPGDPEWDIPLPRVEPETPMAHALGFQSVPAWDRDPPYERPSTLKGWIDLWRHVKETTGVDPLEPLRAASEGRF